MWQSVFCSVCFFIFVVGCSTSGPYMLPEVDDGSQARPEAYAADTMTFRKGMPDRRDWKPWEFYYKHCSINGREAYYSKTSYDCTGPFY
jgi:hypothetical protein